MNVDKSEEKTELRPTDWIKDGVAMDSEGNLVIRDYLSNPNLHRSAHPAYWYKTMERQYELESKLRDVESELNGCRPGRFLPEVIAEMERRAAEAESMRGDGIAGKIMWGQSQAYRDSIALLKTFFR